MTEPNPEPGSHLYHELMHEVLDELQWQIGFWHHDIPLRPRGRKQEESLRELRIYQTALALAELGIEAVADPDFLALPGTEEMAPAAYRLWVSWEDATATHLCSSHEAADNQGRRLVAGGADGFTITPLYSHDTVHRLQRRIRDLEGQDAAPTP